MVEIRVREERRKRGERREREGEGKEKKERKDCESCQIARNASEIASNWCSVKWKHHSKSAAAERTQSNCNQQCLFLLFGLDWFVASSIKMSTLEPVSSTFASAHVSFFDLAAPSTITLLPWALTSLTSFHPWILQGTWNQRTNERCDIVVDNHVMFALGSDEMPARLTTLARKI